MFNILFRKYDNYRTCNGNFISDVSFSHTTTSAFLMAHEERISIHHKKKSTMDSISSVVQRRTQTEVDALRETFNLLSKGEAFISKSVFVQLVGEMLLAVEKSEKAAEKVSPIPEKIITNAFECSERNKDGNIGFVECVIVYGLLKDGHGKGLSKMVYSTKPLFNFSKIQECFIMMIADQLN